MSTPCKEIRTAEFRSVTQKQLDLFEEDHDDRHLQPDQTEGVDHIDLQDEIDAEVKQGMELAENLPKLVEDKLCSISPKVIPSHRCY